MINNYTEQVKIIHSSDGNLIIAYHDNEFIRYHNGRNEYYTRIAVQKIYYNGNPVWEKGVFIIEPDDSLEFQSFNLISDKEGGCYISANTRNINSVGADVKFAQRIDKDGKRVWGERGVTLWQGSKRGVLPPDIYLTSDNNLFINSIAFREDYTVVHYIDDGGAILWQNEISNNYEPFISHLNSNDQLIILGLTGNYQASIRELIADIYNNDGSCVFTEPTVIIDSIEIDLTHRQSNIKSNNYIDLLWSYASDTGNEFNYQIITPEYKTVYDTIGIDTDANRMLNHDQETILVVSGNYKLFKYDLEGKSVWDSTGLVFSLIEDCFTLPVLVSDGNDGIIILWQECLRGLRGKHINKYGEFGKVVSVVQENDFDNIAKDYYISNNYPNPFNPSTRIDYYVPDNSEVTIKITNILGQLVYSEKKNVSKGNHSFLFEPEDINSGVYFCSITLRSLHVPHSINTNIQKLILLK